MMNRGNCEWGITSEMKLNKQKALRIVDHHESWLIGLEQVGSSEILPCFYPQASDVIVVIEAEESATTRTAGLGRGDF